MSPKKEFSGIVLSVGKKQESPNFEANMKYDQSDKITQVAQFFCVIAVKFEKRNQLISNITVWIQSW